MEKVQREQGLRGDLPYLLLILGAVIFFCRDILFTNGIIRASDVITQFFWTAKALKGEGVVDYLRAIPAVFQASWDPVSDGGRTLEGGWNAISLLVHRYLVMHFFPFPSSIAWLAALSLAAGGIGFYYFLRTVGTGRVGAFAGALLFALCTENVSLINASHIQKLEAICWSPWVFVFLHRALVSRRFFNYAMTSLMLAIQFFNMHWQISFYTCLAVGLYWCWFVGADLVAEKDWREARRHMLLATVMVVLFFTTIAMSFAPLFSWSRQSERAGGMSTDEGMSWSMPPEEMATYLIPGMFGFSRQEAGDAVEPGQVFYWGRMHFTQTADYLSLLPWFLLPLPFMLRRDRLTWFFALLMGVTLVMALGRYTFIYRFMFTYLPGFSTFRVPKMILFLFAFGASGLAGIAVDLIAAGAVDRRTFRRWLAWCGAIAAAVVIAAVVVAASPQTVAALFGEQFGEPTRYQSGESLVLDRYLGMRSEGFIAVSFAAAYLMLIILFVRNLLPRKWFIGGLLLVCMGDLARVNARFLCVTEPPQADRRAAKNDVVAYLEPRIGMYRMQPLNEQNAHYYADYGLPNISAYVTISEKRYREFMENFTLNSGMPDMMNLKYLVVPAQEYAAQKDAMAGKYFPVFSSTGGSVVLENRTVLPKAWLVRSVVVVPDDERRLALLRNQGFNPAAIGVVEVPPAVPLSPPGTVPAQGGANVERYEANRIEVRTASPAPALLVVGEKYYPWWYVSIDGKSAEVVPVNHVLRGVYLQPGEHRVIFTFDPLPFRIGKYLTIASFFFFALLIIREVRREKSGA